MKKAISLVLAEAMAFRFVAYGSNGKEGEVQTALLRQQSKLVELQR